MNNRAKLTIRFGTINHVDSSYINFSFKDSSGNKSDILYGAMPWDDFSDLYTGEEIYILEYIDSPRLIYGFVDRKKYENPIRESQKLPKGWIREPYMGFITIQGKLEFDDTTFEDEIHICSNDGKKYTLAMYDFNNFEDFKFVNGDEVVITSNGIIYPDGSIGFNDTNIYKKDEYYSKYKDDVEAYYYDKYYSEKAKSK